MQLISFFSFQLGINPIKKPITPLCIIAAQNQTLLPRSAARRPQYFPTTHWLLQYQKVERVLFPCACSRFILFSHYVLGEAVRTSPPSSLHSIAFSSFHPLEHRTASGNTHFHFASSFIPFSPSHSPMLTQWYISTFAASQPR